MTTYIALLRGVNVGGHRPVSMADLRNMLEQLGFSHVQSLLQSGNLIFRSNAKTAAGVERLLESEAERRLELHADFILRTAKEWNTVVDRNPFRNEAERDPGHLVVMFLKQAPSVKGVQAVDDGIAGPEIVRADGRQLYIVYPAGIGRSRLTNVLLEKELGIRGTARNWNTVIKVAALINE